MSRRSTPSMGALHPVLFFVFIYGISLFLALFVCRTVYLSLNDEPSMTQVLKANAQNSAATALR